MKNNKRTIHVLYLQWQTGTVKFNFISTTFMEHGTQICNQENVAPKKQVGDFS